MYVFFRLTSQSKVAILSLFIQKPTEMLYTQTFLSTLNYNRNICIDVTLLLHRKCHTKGLYLVRISSIYQPKHTNEAHPHATFMYPKENYSLSLIKDV